MSPSRPTTSPPFTTTPRSIPRGIAELEAAEAAEGEEAEGDEAGEGEGGEASAEPPTESSEPDSE